MSENLKPVTAETSSEEDDDEDSPSTASNFKKKSLGAFLVESEPPKKSSAEESKSGLFGKRKKAEELPDEVFETLESSEQSEAVRQLAAARRNELEDGNAELSLEDQAEIAAAAVYMATAETSGDIDAAYAQTLADLDATKGIETDQEQEIDTNTPHEGEIYQQAPTETVAEAEEAEVEANTVPAPPTPPVPPQPPRPGATASSAGASGPPPPPRPPIGSPSGPSGPSGPGRPSGPGGPAGAPTQSSVETISLAAARANERRAATDGLVVGAVVGYLFGRRRGRIKTEKRLLPVQKKLEKQVTHLQSELLYKENVIRQKARQAARQGRILEAPPRPVSERRGERPQPKFIPLERQPAVPNLVPPERIGHVLVSASVSPERRPTIKEVIKTPKMETVAARKQAETMSRTELLLLSEKVKVDGTSLRKIYESQLVTEKGLRRLVTEYLRGGNVSRALKRELVEHQIDFERDPILRDKQTASSATVAATNGAGKAALTAFLIKAGVSPEAESQPLGAKPIKPASVKKPANNETKTQRRTSVTDVALITLITVLIIAIYAILSNR